VKPSLRKSRRWKYCLDTGPLLDHFVLSFFEERERLLPQKLAKKVKFMGNNPQLRNRFRNFLQGENAFVTCPGVLLEVEKHFQSADDAGHLGSFREFLRQQVEKLNIEERLVPWGRLEVEELKLFGSVDASLMALLRGAEEDTLKLVTMDEILSSECTKRRLHCMDVHQLLDDEGA
jgi:hypothetical protein